ncbi:uncharacterized protein [Argopecten irradians]|uniref:uncharacterized protein n=1 Tax=Argopecten irradians TaxID=31199 RepID=UPI00371B1C57
MTAEAARFCAENHIILYCLLPNATHADFPPMKSAWRGNVKQWQMDNLGKAFTKYDFPKVFKQSWETCATLSNAAHAFKRSGLFPLTAEGIDQSKLGPCKLISKEKLETKEREAEETDDGDAGTNDINLSDNRPNAVALSCQAKHSTTNDKDCDKENVIVQRDIADVHVSAVVGNMTRNEHAVSAAFQTLVIPEIKTGKNKSKRKKLPKALSGHETLEMFKQKEEEKIEEERNKKERAEKRIENKQKKIFKMILIPGTHYFLVRSYYKAQDGLIETYENIEELERKTPEEISREPEKKSSAAFLAKLSLAANLVLLIAKLAAAIMSGSISVISSLVDSIVDFASGIVIWATTRAMKNRNLYEYPQGRTKLEPIAIVVLSVIMSLASLQLIRESAEKFIDLANHNSTPPSFTVPTIIITASTVVIKFILYLLCRPILKPTVQALAQDHRNDVLSNSVALVCGYLGKYSQYWTGVYIITSITDWSIQICLIKIVYFFPDQTKMLTGFTANPDFLKKITWISINHDSRIQYVETVRAFHFGNNFLVEVDIVLPQDMTLSEAHNIGEPLQQRLERLPEVERAFVHLDYNIDHDPKDEHKVM